jgi:hypothetical protein
MRKRSYRRHEDSGEQVLKTNNDPPQRVAPKGMPLLK